jgi:Fur family ferric uptake transcriptional regulator
MVKNRESRGRMTPVEAAEAAIRRTGARVTPARIQVLALLLKEEQPLTHQQIESSLRRTYGTDRVTIYRVLEWLTRNGLASRVATSDRAGRFDAIDPDHGHRHAHFQCDQCGTVTCLEDVRQAPKLKLPEGYRSSEVELTVKGLCAVCVPARRGAKRFPSPGRTR